MRLNIFTIYGSVRNMDGPISRLCHGPVRPRPSAGRTSAVQCSGPTPGRWARLRRRPDCPAGGVAAGQTRAADGVLVTCSPHQSARARVASAAKHTPLLTVKLNSPIALALVVYAIPIAREDTTPWNHVSTSSCYSPALTNTLRPIVSSSTTTCATG